MATLSTEARNAAVDGVLDELYAGPFSNFLISPPTVVFDTLPRPTPSGGSATIQLSNVTLSNTGTIGSIPVSIFGTTSIELISSLQAGLIGSGADFECTGVNIIAGQKMTLALTITMPAS